MGNATRTQTEALTTAMDECLWHKEGSVQDETVVRVSELTETTQKEKKGGALGLNPGPFGWMRRY